MPGPGPARVILASASPRRHDLLAEAGLRFRIEPGDVDESVAADATCLA